MRPAGGRSYGWPESVRAVEAYLNGVQGASLVAIPQAPAGKEHNWIETIPGKGWFLILRHYSPLQPFFDKTWRPSEIESHAPGSNGQI